MVSKVHRTTLVVGLISPLLVYKPKLIANTYNQKAYPDTSGKSIKCRNELTANPVNTNDAGTSWFGILQLHNQGVQYIPNRFLEGDIPDESGCHCEYSYPRCFCKGECDCSATLVKRCPVHDQARNKAQMKQKAFMKFLGRELTDYGWHCNFPRKITPGYYRQNQFHIYVESNLVSISHYTPLRYADKNRNFSITNADCTYILNNRDIWHFLLMNEFITFKQLSEICPDVTVQSRKLNCYGREYIKHRNKIVHTPPSMIKSAAY